LDIRRFLRSLLIKNNIRVPVLSFQDLAPEFTVQPVVTIRIEALHNNQVDPPVKQLEAAETQAANADAAD
jgi:type III secretion protein V